MSCVREFLTCASEQQIDELLAGLSDNAIQAMPYLFELWALEQHQVAPDGNWTNWVIMGGRGAGKTRAGAEWVRAQVEGNGPLDAGRCKRIALVGETLDQAREVMVFGDSGILACCPPDRKPKWIATRRMLVWPNGAEAQIFSASDPETLRGPQFDGAWLDELAKWRKGQDAWDMLQFALRLGDKPRQVITTTPRASGLLDEILDSDATVVTQAATSVNSANLAADFLTLVTEKYGGTALGRQELDGELVRDLPGALWSRAQIEDAKVREVPDLDRIIVAVDPPVTGHSKSDACGIVVAGVQMSGPPHQWRAFILEDGSIQGASPTEWARSAVSLFTKWQADRMVAEVNQGGDLVETLIRQIDPAIPFTGVHASRGKVARAEPVSALYEQGRVAHVTGLNSLEDEMCAMARSGYAGTGSPDRVDALVWALTDLLVVPMSKWSAPRVRTL